MEKILAFVGMTFTEGWHSEGQGRISKVITRITKLSLMELHSQDSFQRQAGPLRYAPRNDEYYGSSPNSRNLIHSTYRNFGLIKARMFWI